MIVQKRVLEILMLQENSGIILIFLQGIFYKCSFKDRYKVKKLKGILFS